jgi:hypothetical protein
MPFLSCILVSHDKAPFVGQAIASLVAQTFPDWEAVVFDSGVLHDQGFFKRLRAMDDRRLHLVRSWETEELRRSRTIASWCFNECFRKNLVHGEYVTYLCDDDLLYPHAFQAYYDHVQSHPGVLAMYASIDVVAENARGEKRRLRELLAKEVKGKCCGGGPLDRQVDYLQLCHHRDVLKYFGDEEYWPEDRAVMRHADGIFLERIGSHVPIHPVAAKIGQNRKVPLSLNDGGERLEDLLRLHALEEETGVLRAAIAGLQAENSRLQQTLAEFQGRLRYRVVDKLNRAFQHLPLFHSASKKLVVAGWNVLKRTSKKVEKTVPAAGLAGTLRNGHSPINGARREALGQRPRAAGSGKPHLLFVTEKWCDGKPEAGITNNEHNLFGSLEVSGLATYERLHVDEYRLQHGRNCDAELLQIGRTRRPDAIVACHLFGSDRNVQPETWRQIHQLGIPVVFIWFDAVLEARMQVADSLAPYAALNLVLDTAAYKTAFPDKFRPMWTPQDTRYFYNPRGAREIDVCFLGSMAGYQDRLVELTTLRNQGIAVFQGGGQREQALPLPVYANVLQRSKICLSFPLLRGDPTLVQAKGRIFEVTLCGALLLDAANDQTSRWFTPGEDYASFRDGEDLLQKIPYFLEHEDERAQMAHRGWVKASTAYSPARFWHSVLESLGVLSGDLRC